MVGEGVWKRRGGPRSRAPRRGRGRGGLREAAGGAPSTPGPPAAAALGRCARPSQGQQERLSVESPGRPEEEAGAAPERSQRTAPPGSGAQRWVPKLGRGGLRHLVPGAPSWCWGLWRGDRVAREGLVIWKALGCTEDFKGLLWSLPSGACAERGPAFLGKGCDHVALNS